MSEPLKIGSTVWLFNVNRRVYAKRDGHGGGPIYRHHFEPLEIIGETRVSWLCGPAWSPRKVNKKTMETAGGYGLSTHVFASQQEVDDACWIHENKPAIERAVRTCQDAAILRHIDGVLGGTASQAGTSELRTGDVGIERSHPNDTSTPTP